MLQPIFVAMIQSNNTTVVFHIVYGYRPLVVPQKHLIHFDNYIASLYYTIPSFKPLTLVKHLVSAPLDDKDNSYTALSEQFYSYSELLFFSLKNLPFMV